MSTAITSFQCSKPIADEKYRSYSYREILSENCQSPMTGQISNELPWKTPVSGTGSTVFWPGWQNLLSRIASTPCADGFDGLKKEVPYNLAVGPQEIVRLVKDTLD